MSNMKEKIKNIFKKEKKSYEEIFSNSDNKPNMRDTNPLELDDNDDKIIIRGYRQIDFAKEPVSCEYSDDVDYNFTLKQVKKDVFKMKLAAIFSVIAFLISATVDISYRFYPEIFKFVPIEKNYMYLYAQGAINIIFLIFIMFKAIKKMKISSKFALNGETMAFFTGVFSLIYCVSLIFTLGTQNLKSVNVYVSLFCLYAVLLNFNNLFLKLRIKRNFKFVTGKKEKYGVGLYSKDGIEKGKSCTVAYRKKISELNELFCDSYQPTKLCKITTLLNALALALSATTLIINIANRQSLNYIVASANVSLLMLGTVPFLSCINGHVNGACKKALKKGAMITGIYACDSFFKTDAMVADAAEIYPAENVVLRSIKTFKGQRIDEAILRAATVVCAIGGPLSKVFDKIIMGKRTILSEPTDVIYEDNMGIVGFVDSQRVLVGNRELLKKYRVDPPSRDYEKKYVEPGMNHIYFAIGKDLVAMFIIEYLPNKKLKNCLSTLSKNGIKLLVRTTDCNITTEKIGADFNIAHSEIQILKFETSRQIDKIENIKSRKIPQALCTLEKFSSLMFGICFSKMAVLRKNITFMIMILSLALSGVFVLSLSITGGITNIKAVELGVYYAFWVLVAMIVPKFNII